ncbi:DUF945 family protein [Salinicola halophyticus]|uniref:DUF945 family protein n=1 Tax=Salinicola halophyticus TaxID=1808881 RepID=UPI003F45DB12
MRKWMIAGAIVIVLAGGGYLGAQAYSSQRFDSEIDKLVVRLDARPGWQVSRDDIDSGWFHSSGRIEARYMASTDADSFLVEVPYEAGHGLLETTLDGEAQVRGSDGETLFGDVLESEGPLTWHGRFLTRDQKLEAHFTLPGFSQTVSVPASEVPGEVPGEGGAGETTAPRDMQLEFDGFEMDIEQAGDKVTLNGQAPRLRLADDRSDILIENTTLSGMFAGDDQAFQQSVTLAIAAATVTPSGGPSVVSKDLGYTLDAKLDPQQLTLHVQADVGDTRMRDQSMFNGGLELTLDHVDGDGYRALAAALDDNLPRIQTAIDADDDQALESAMAPLRPSMKKLLAGSPRLSLDRLTANSPMLGMKLRGQGELGIDGDGIESWNFDTMGDEAMGRELTRRLDGQLTLEGAPAILLMYLGLPMSSDPLQIKLADGVLEINGQQMPLLP